MGGYERFSAFYDRVMDDPTPRALHVISRIARHHPEARTLLELGCGTGAILARLPEHLVTTGLDASASMLAQAALTSPRSTLIEADMADFALPETYDVIVAVFDTINHLVTFGEWESFFASVHRHLATNGIVIFDVNTVGELRRLGEEPPWVYDFDDGTAIIDVTYAESDDGLVHSLWDIRIFEHLRDDTFQLHAEVVGELGVPLARLQRLCRDHFMDLEWEDEDGGEASDDAVKIHAVLRRNS